MPSASDLCWVPVWNAKHPGIGLEHARVTAGQADSSLLAVDEDGMPFRLHYQLQWDSGHVLRHAELTASKESQTRRLSMRIDGAGRWTDGDGKHLAHLDGCVDIDIWPTPLTNSFPLWRSQLRVGERQEFRMAWVSAPGLTVEARAQAYTRLADRLYLFESLDETGFSAELPVDDDGFVVDYPGLFRRVAVA